jgi:hypothetical protein
MFETPLLLLTKAPAWRAMLVWADADARPAERRSESVFMLKAEKECRSKRKKGSEHSFEEVSASFPWGEGFLTSSLITTS